jgi:hypothetical protein
MDEGGDNIKNMMTSMVNNLTQGPGGGIPGGDGLVDMIKMMMSNAMPESESDKMDKMD